MANELNDFLGGEAAPADVGAADVASGGADAAAAAGADGAGDTPAADAGAGGADAAAAAEGAPAAAAVDPPEEIPEDIRGLRSALQAERGKRNDYKGERDRYSGELTATKAALAAAEARLTAAAAAPVVAAAPAIAPAAVDPPAAPVIPNPLEDPQGYHTWQQNQTQRMLFNERLNLSEAMLRDTPGLDKVDEKLAAFQKAVGSNPALRADLSRQSHPYKWAYEQGGKLLAMAEVGDDPAAFRARVEAEVRAKIEAELSGAAPATGAVEAIVIPRSLAGQTSSAPRMAAVEQAPAFEDIFKRKARA